MAENISATSQEFVPIKEVRDGIAILKDGSMCFVYMASSLNFALKSGEEQQAILMQFQNFLNSLDFTIQISIQSRRLDIKPYLAMLDQLGAAQTDDLLRIQTREYREFIRKFTETVNIMSKNFFVVVPYSPNIINFGGAEGGFLSNLIKKLTGGSQKDNTAEETRQFEENRMQLEQRASVVTQGLSRLGVRTLQLGTEELVELYYRTFNPDETTGIMAKQ